MPLRLLAEKRTAPARRNLRVCGDGLHTFGTLTGPLAIGLIAAGFYLLGAAFLHPVAADSASLILGALLLSLGFVLVSYLLRSAMASQVRTRVSPPARLVPETFSDRPPQQLRSDSQQDIPLPSHRMYVDRARIVR